MENMVLEKLRDAGLRYTLLKDKILDVFKTADCPLTVPELSKQLKKKRFYPHKTSLYRELEALVNIGLLEEMQLHEGVQSFELKEENNHHHHFICRNCNDVIDFKNEKVENALVATVQGLRRKGHEIDDHQLNLYGLCNTCQS